MEIIFVMVTMVMTMEMAMLMVMRMVMTIGDDIDCDDNRDNSDGDENHGSDQHCNIQATCSPVSVESDTIKACICTTDFCRWTKFNAFIILIIQ